MNVELYKIVLQRLEDETFLGALAKRLVTAACEGDEALASALGETGGSPPSEMTAPAGRLPVKACLSSIAVEGFRGIGPESTLSFRSGPGLSLVVGRNGSGKSSFAEALEILLTGDNRRWKDRSAAWKEDWRNLHHGHTRIEATMLVEGDTAPATVCRTWQDGAKDVTSSALEVRRSGRQKGGLNALGWTGDVQIYRPFLSYNELGSMLDDGPSRLYDALSTVLGLEDLVGAQELLRRARLSRANGRKDAVDKLKTLRSQLAGCDDARARACLAALDARPWDLDGAERQVLHGGAPGTDGGELGRLQHLAACPVPSSPAVAEAAAALTSAAQAAIAVAGTESARALEQADLLDKALAFHRQHTAADCPVCGTPAVLGPAWEQRSDAAVRQLRAEAHAADTARRSVQEARAAAMALLAPAPAVLDEAKGLGFDADVAVVRSHWDDWASLATIEDPEELARALLERAGELEVAVTALQTAAAAEMARREDSWRPVAAAVAEWIGPARLAVAGAAAIPAITDAENWVKTASAAIREERFAPIADQAAEVWDTLRGQSNVALQRVSLGAYPQRKVTLDVTVDGVGGAALGVMSQGELHALALSLFLPRATLPASPFRFIVIDDPVQSMDPARVEGLARVLEQAAATRQVIVFTHDDRLPEVCRRLQIETQTIEVSRRPGSVVELTKVTSPIDRYLSEAAAIARTKELAETVTTRVAGAFCRMALEAACTEALVRRRLGRGERHEAVEVLVAGAGSLAEKASLALFDQEGRSPGEVRDRLGKFGPWAPEVFKRANTGSHQALSAAALGNLVDDTRRLARQLVALP